MSAAINSAVWTAAALTSPGGRNTRVRRHVSKSLASGSNRLTGWAKQLTERETYPLSGATGFSCKVHQSGIRILLAPGEFQLNLRYEFQLQVSAS